MKSYKPIPLTWGRKLTNREHYECYMLRQAGCDCDIPDIFCSGFSDDKPVVKCRLCNTHAICVPNEIIDNEHQTLA